MNVYRCNLSKYQKKDYSAREMQLVAQLGSVYQESLIENGIHADVLITNSNSDLSSLPIQWDKVKLIIHPNSGYDNFTSSLIEKINAPIVIGNRIRANAVASYTLSCFFHAFANIPFSYSWDEKRKWNRKNIDELSVLLIGHGHIGKILKSSLQPLVGRLEIYDPFDLDMKYIHLPDLSDFDSVIMAAGLNKTSKQMIDKKFLQKLPTHCVLINGARGKLIEQASLLNHLAENKEFQVYLDVFETEPERLENWSKLPNAYLSSHIAGVYKSLDGSILSFVKEVLKNFQLMSKHAFKASYGEQILQEKTKRVPLYE